MSQIQALEKRVKRADHDDRHIRSLGLDHMNDATINLTKVVVKADTDIRAARDGRWADLKMVSASDVEISGPTAFRSLMKVAPERPNQFTGD